MISNKRKTLVNKDNNHLGDVQLTDTHLPVIGNRMNSLLPIIKIFSKQTETLLLQGPTGSGKSRLALWCHHQSLRKSLPFEVVDLSTVPDGMKLAKLFGWKKGAFTGAYQSSRGALGRAIGGTIFIDEIDKLSLESQSGLLQLLETGCYSPLGDDSAIKNTNVRIIIGTNADLIDLVNKGLFREDLYYRINILPISIPALDERLDEIIPWSEYMLQKCHDQNTDLQGLSKGKLELSNNAKERLLQRKCWPGNLRQLDNIIRRTYAIHLSQSPTSKKINGECIESAFSMEVGATPSFMASSHNKVMNNEGESSDVSDQLSISFWRTAKMFVDLAENKSLKGECLDLDLAESLKGYVICEALKRKQKKKCI